MTKKDFELIAGVFNCFVGYAEDQNVESMAKKMADKFGAINPPFNTEMFLRACGIESEKCYCECEMSVPHYH